MADIKKMAEEIEERVTSNVKDAKELIKSFTAQIVEKEKEIMAPSEIAHAGNLEKYRGDKENVTSQVENLRATLDAKREKIATLAKQALNMMEKCSEATVSSQLADSRTAYALSLYAKISNISWDYKAPSGKTAGTIGSEESKTLRRFEIDTREKTSFEAANDLWAMIEEGNLAVSEYP